VIRLTFLLSFLPLGALATPLCLAPVVGCPCVGNSCTCSSSCTIESGSGDSLDCNAATCDFRIDGGSASCNSASTCTVSGPTGTVGCTFAQCVINLGPDSYLDCSGGSCSGSLGARSTVEQSNTSTLVGVTMGDDATLSCGFFGSCTATLGHRSTVFCNIQSSCEVNVGEASRVMCDGLSACTVVCRGACEVAQVGCAPMCAFGQLTRDGGVCRCPASDGGTRPDGGGFDAGPPTVDAGTSGGLDASILFDAGTADSGTMSLDAGAGNQDAGGATDGGRLDGGDPLDAGASVDAGVSLDAGQPVDSGLITMDAGPTTMDAGLPFQVDAGDPGETVSPDAGLTRRTPLQLAVGCSHSSLGVDPAALLLLALAWRASRARR
jgi:hypothetical protein